VVALAAGGVALALAMRKPPPTPPPEVAYEMTASTADASSETAPPDAAPAAPPVDRKHAPPAPPRPRTPRDFTRRFAAREPEVAACFRKHTIEGSQVPPMSVHFHVGQDGMVIAARVEPESIAATPLGACLAATARSARFGQLDKELHFAIPLRVK
jgi:hypothetical protein